MFEISKIEYYRKGYVIKETLDNLYCCHIAEVTKPVLDYIELVYKDGNRIFIYEDEEAFRYVEKNFHSERFTSFFELFTTEELATEDRGFVKLDYYVRRGQESYINMPLKDALASLNGNIEKQARYTTYGQYDGEVNYHLD